MNTKLKRSFAAAALIVAILIAVLWSWNTLAGLYGAPLAEFKHVVAAGVLLGVLRTAINANNWRDRRRGGHHG